MSTAHPRSRGENTEADEDSRALWGSSPLTRGKREQRAARRVLRGLIPAHAGKTHLQRPAQGTVRAHPRSRGENRSRTSPAKCTSGSSPLTRGKLDGPAAHPQWTRLIPAHAGKTFGQGAFPWEVGAHPRSRGENYQAHATALSAGGSSPLTRGKLDRGLTAPKVSGLIPAHAGKTSEYAGLRTTLKAHPRSRGENFSRT